MRVIIDGPCALDFGGDGGIDVGIYCRPGTATAACEQEQASGKERRPEGRQ
jgi:hypothetical protein